MPNEIAVREVEGEWISAEKAKRIDAADRSIKFDIPPRFRNEQIEDEMLEQQRTNSISGMPNMPEHIRKILCSEARKEDQSWQTK